MKKSVLLSFLICFFVVEVKSQTRTFINKLWQDLTGTPDTIDWSQTTYDLEGNIIIVGNTGNGVSTDLLLSKYESNGNLLFEVTYDDGNNDYGVAATTDVHGNIYVAGTSDNVGTTGYDYIVQCYDPEGDLQWTVTYNGPGDAEDVPTSIVLDIAGDVYVTGASQGSGTGLDYATIKVKNDGSATLWEERYDGNSLRDVPVSVFFQGSKVVVAGVSATSIYDNDIYIITYDDDDGAFVDDWSDGTSMLGFEGVTGVARDSGNNIYLTGWAMDGYNSDIQIVKLDSALNFIWTVAYDGDGGLNNYNDQGNDIAVDAQGNVYVCGTVGKAGSSWDGVLLKYDYDNNLIWERKIDINSQGIKLVLDNDHLIVASYVKKINDFDTHFSCYDLDGNIQWGHKFSSAGEHNDFPISLKVDMEGNLFLTYIRADTINREYGIAKFEILTIANEPYEDEELEATYIAHQVIVKFKPSIVNLDFADTRSLRYQYLTEIIPDTTYDKIYEKIPFKGIDYVRAVKVYEWMTYSDSISTNRMGDQFTMAPLWSTYILLLPEGVSEKEVVDSLNRIHPDVEFAELNYVNFTTSIPNDDFIDDQTSMVANVSYADANINLDEAWDMEIGQSFIKVGIVDEGVVDYTHSDFGDGTFSGSKIIGGYDFNYSVDASQITSFGKHATACGGIYGALRNDHQGVAGIGGGDVDNAANSGISMITLSCPGLSNDMTADAIAYGSSVTYDGNQGFACNILSNSYAGHHSSITMAQAVSLCFANHCVFVASRGNRLANVDDSYNDLIMYPACFQKELVINVGASDENGWHQDVNDVDNNYESMYDNNVDIIAPGSNATVVTLAASNLPAYSGYSGDPTHYTWFNGTSSSCPHAVGVAALMLSHHIFNGYPNALDDYDIQYLLKKYAQDIGGEGATLVGNGKIDAGATLSHIDLGHGYWIEHSTNGSCSGALTTMGTNITFVLTQNAYGLPAGTYFANLVKSTYTYTIPLPAFAVSPQIIDAWSSHSSGMSAANPNDGSFYSNISYSIGGGNISATMYSYSWQIMTNAIGQTINQWIPSVTNLMNSCISFQMYDEEMLAVTDPDINSLSELSIYPNPADKSTLLSFDSKMNDIVTCEIFDVTGKCIIKKENYKVAIGIYSDHLDTSFLPNGIYTIRLLSEKNLICKKFVVSH